MPSAQCQPCTETLCLKYDIFSQWQEKLLLPYLFWSYPRILRTWCFACSITGILSWTWVVKRSLSFKAVRGVFCIQLSNPRQLCLQLQIEPLNRWYCWKHMKRKESIQSMNLQCSSCICNWLSLKHSMFNTNGQGPNPENLARTAGPHSRSLFLRWFHTALLHYLWAMWFAVLTERFQKTRRHGWLVFIHPITWQNGL